MTPSLEPYSELLQIFWSYLIDLDKSLQASSAVNWSTLWVNWVDSYIISVYSIILLAKLIINTVKANINYSYKRELLSLLILLGKVRTYSVKTLNFLVIFRGYLQLSASKCKSNFSIFWICKSSPQYIYKCLTWSWTSSWWNWQDSHRWIKYCRFLISMNCSKYTMLDEFLYFSW